MYIMSRALDTRPWEVFSNQREDREYSQNGRGVGSPVGELAIAVQRRYHLHQFDQGAECGEPERDSPPWSTRIGEASEDRQHDEGDDVQKLVRRFTGDRRRMRQAGHHERNERGRPEAGHPEAVELHQATRTRNGAARIGCSRKAVEPHAPTD